MTEALLGYFEGIFLLLAIIMIGVIAWRVYKPSRKEEMEKHGRSIFEGDE